MKPTLKPQQIRKPARWAWLNWRILMIFVILGVLMMAMAISEPLPGRRNLKSNYLAARFAGNASVQQVTPTLTQATLPASESSQTATVVVNPLVTPSPTPIPEEWLTNRGMADGIVLGAVALVLIVLGGTLSVIRRRP